MTEPRTLTEAVNLGKVYGIDTAETILTLAIAKAIENNRGSCEEDYFWNVINDIKSGFKAECARYKADLTKPVTEEEKKQILEP